MKLTLMNTKFLLFSAFLFGGVILLGAQQKYEREYRVDVNQIPEAARAFVNKCAFEKRIRWYAEESQDGKTLEAKAIKNKHKYSIEFRLDGTVIDVEKKISWDELSSMSRQQIEASLRVRFGRYKIKKIQEQVKGREEDLIAFIHNKPTDFENASFEIIVKAKNRNDSGFYEVLVDSKGNIVRELRFATRHYDNIEF